MSAAERERLALRLSELRARGCDGAADELEAEHEPVERECCGEYETGSGEHGDECPVTAEVRMLAASREQLGREVRAVWVAWAQEQPNPKPSWLLPWEDLDEPSREVDRRIGERLYALGACIVDDDGETGEGPHGVHPGGRS